MASHPHVLKVKALVSESGGKGSDLMCATYTYCAHSARLQLQFWASEVQTEQGERVTESVWFELWQSLHKLCQISLFGKENRGCDSLLSEKAEPKTALHRAELIPPFATQNPSISMPICQEKKNGEWNGMEWGRCFGNSIQCFMDVISVNFWTGLLWNWKKCP